MAGVSQRRSRTAQKSSLSINAIMQGTIDLTRACGEAFYFTTKEVIILWQLLSYGLVSRRNSF